MLGEPYWWRKNSPPSGAPPFSRLLREGGDFDFAGAPFSRASFAREVGVFTSLGGWRPRLTVYNPPMTLVEQIQKDIVAAMKAKDEARLSCLRMMKSALQLRQVEKMAPLDDKESQAVLATLIKQRKESVEQFSKGGRQEMANKESAEIVVIESYLPKAAGEAEIVAGVKGAIAEMGAPTMKEMGTVMKNAMAKFNAAGMRVDGKVVSEIVKKELAGK
jgi:uncharacterized protein